MKLVSFGFKYGVPNANHYFDVSWIKNPARGENRTLHSKLDGEMVAEVLSDRLVVEYLNRVVPLLVFLNKQDVQVVAFGCSSGRHRSPIIVQTVQQILKETYKIDSVIKHRDKEQ